ncbi:hypothetical protein CFC21_055593 [Triticum aestivum]|uniref:Uncharacterized protein n=2 Tax=Triticum aestivum TaxID=4565 RepID=A0A3B6I643_WHEAT|nr:hypothetical protein CFC21_055593 [Triticum aestivum]
MVAAGPLLPCSCVGNPESGAAAPLARHGRLTVVRVVDPVSRPRGRRDLVVVGGVFYGGRCARSGASLPPLFGVRASLVGPRFLLVAGSVQEVLLVAKI